VTHDLSAARLSEVTAMLLVPPSPTPTPNLATALTLMTTPVALPVGCQHARWMVIHPTRVAAPAAAGRMVGCLLRLECV
jgi:hypothetical protein